MTSGRSDWCRIKSWHLTAALDAHNLIAKMVLGGGQSVITVTKTLAFHVAELGLIPGIPHDPLSVTKNNS